MIPHVVVVLLALFLGGLFLRILGRRFLYSSEELGRDILKEYKGLSGSE